MTVAPTIALLAGALASAQSELPREVLDLARIEADVRENLATLPRFTCLETVERSHRARGKPAFQLVDTLRLEVTRIGQEELYSWPGGRRFEGNAGTVVGGGTISTGEFFGHASNVFGNSATQIRFARREPSFSSGWTLTFAGKRGVVASYGSFWADAETLELLRLDAHADEIPPDLPFTAAESRIDYAKVQIGERSVLLPQSAQLLVAREGSEDRNEAAFSQCRPYSTESILRVGAPAAISAEPAPVEELSLAPNLPLSLQLTQSIDSASAMEGDTILARVAADVRFKDKILVPKGAAARGRIRRLERYSEPVPHFIVGLEFIEIEFQGKRWTFRGRLDQADPVSGLSWALSTKSAETIAGDRGADAWQIFKGETLYTESVPGLGTFFMQGSKFRLPQGFRMLWRTLPGVDSRRD